MIEELEDYFGVKLVEFDSVWDYLFYLGNKFSNLNVKIDKI